MVKLSRRKLRQGLWWSLLIAMLAGGLGFGLYRLGRHVTPSGYPPVIYAPSVRRTETYRRAARAWLADLQRVDGELTRLVSAPDMDVYVLAQAAQAALEQSTALAQAISLLYPPASLTSLRDGLQESADLYLEAAVLLNRWVGEPTQELYVQTLEALRVARATCAALVQNPWMQAETPVTSPVYVPATPAGQAPATPATWGE